ncbi:hypothetical protein ScPMuIL_010812 [Solemya velum]
MGATASNWARQTAIAAGSHYLKDIKNRIRILNLEATIENQPTAIDEGSSSVLKYKTPNFRANATVEFAPTKKNHKWKVGWIQACTDMMFHNTYGEEGYTSWEFPELTSKDQNMISDCDGHHYPWYGSRNEAVIVQGPCKLYQKATVTMNDNFHPHVTWRNPANRSQVEPNLTHIIRDQSFYVWLVAWNITMQKAYILKTIRWQMKLEIAVNPLRPLGQRARLISNPVPDQPVVQETNVTIPRCALTPPNANSAQMLVWRPIYGLPSCIIPPVWKKDVPIDKQITHFDRIVCKL